MAARITKTFETVSYTPFKDGYRVRIDKDRSGALQSVFYGPRAEARAKAFADIVAIFLSNGLSRRDAWKAAWQAWEDYGSLSVHEPDKHGRSLR